MKLQLHYRLHKRKPKLFLSSTQSPSKETETTHKRNDGINKASDPNFLISRMMIAFFQQKTSNKNNTAASKKYQNHP